MFYNLNKQVNTTKDSSRNTKKLNLAVTVSHICLILCYTIASFFTFNLPYSNGSKKDLVPAFRASSAWTFIGGVCDLFLTCMVWLILDEKKLPNFVSDGRHSYAVIEVIRPRNSISDDDDNSEHGLVEDSYISGES
jgi:hypothetical protein